MAARPNPNEYSLPAHWVPVSGELARGRCLMALSESERLIFYNQDVLYHQNLEILQMLDELRGQNSQLSPNITGNRQNQTSAATEEAEGVQKSVVDMAAPPVPSVRLPPVRNAAPSASSTAPTVPSGLCSTTDLTAVINTRNASPAQSSLFTLARANSLSGFAPMPSTLLNPQELPPVVKVPLSQENLQVKSQGKWQEKFNSLLSTKNEQGKREAHGSDSEEDNNHGKASNPIRQELFKRRKLEEDAKVKDGNAVSGTGFGFSTVGADSNQGSAEKTSLGPSSAVGFLESASKLKADILSAHSLFQGNESPLQSNESTAGACPGTTTVLFKAYQEKESAGSSETTHFQSINRMPEYSKLSFEELRLADYAQGKRFGPFTAPAGFGLVKSGEATTFADFAQRNTTGPSPSNRVTTAESPFAKALRENSLSRPATSIFGTAPAQPPARTSEFMLGSKWAFSSATINSPSNRVLSNTTHPLFSAPDSINRLRAATEGQSRWEAQKSEIMSRFEMPPKPATSIFPNLSASTTAAPSPANTLTSSSLQPRWISNATAPFTAGLAHGNFLIARKCHSDDKDLSKDEFIHAWNARRLLMINPGINLKSSLLLCFSDGKNIVLELKTSEEVAEADGVKISNGNCAGHYYLCKAYQHATESPGDKTDTAEAQSQPEAQTSGFRLQSNESHKPTTNESPKSPAALHSAAFQSAASPDKYLDGVLPPREDHEYAMVRAGVRRHDGRTQMSDTVVDCDVHGYLNKTTKSMTFLIIRRSDSKLMYNTANIPGRIGNAGVTIDGLGGIRVFHVVGVFKTEYEFRPTEFGELARLVHASNGTTW